MNARSVFKRAWRKPGIQLTLLLVMLCTACSAQQPTATKIFVLSANRGCKITTYTLDGKQIDPEIGIGGFTCNGMVMDSHGNLLVSIMNRGVMKFNSEDGKGKMFIGAPSASAIAIDRKQIIHLLITKDTDNWQVRTFSPNGAGSAWPMTINLAYVSGIALNSEGTLYALSQGNSVIRMYEPDGRQLVQSIHTGDTPKAIAVAPDGKIYFANFLSVTSLLPDGKTPVWPALKHAAPGGGFDNPTALTVGDDGTLYIGYNGGSVGIIGADGKPRGGVFQALPDIRGIAVR
ncbi:MAG: hypothetical protein JO323_14595 [Acidobacteriia bacterium]|nr:hypothetical protein [Terriglobia bacterium]